MVAFNRCGLVVCLVAMALDCHHAAKPSIGRALRTRHTKTARHLAVILSLISSVKNDDVAACHLPPVFGWRAALRAAFWGMGERSVLVGGLPRPVLPVRRLCHAGPVVAFCAEAVMWLASAFPLTRGPNTHLHR